MWPPGLTVSMVAKETTMSVTNGTVTKTLISLIDASSTPPQAPQLEIGPPPASLIVGTRGVEFSPSAPGRQLHGRDDDVSFDPADYASPEEHHQALAEVMGLQFPHRSKQVPSGRMHLTSMSIRKRGRRGVSWIPFSKPLEITLPDGSKSSTLYFEDACPAQWMRMQNCALQRTRDFFIRSSRPENGFKISLRTKQGYAHPDALVIDFGSESDERLHEFIHDFSGHNSRFICDGRVHTQDGGNRGVDLQHPLNRLVVDIKRNGNVFDLVRDIHHAMKDAWEAAHRQACLDVAEDLALEAGLGSFHYAYRAKPTDEMSAFMKAKANSSSEIGQLADNDVVLTMQASEALYATTPQVITAQPNDVKLLKLTDQLRISMSKSSFTERALQSWRDAFDAKALGQACKDFVLGMDADVPSLAMRILGRSTHRLNAAIFDHLESMRLALDHGGLAALHVPGAVLLALPEHSAATYSAEEARCAAIGLEAMRDALADHLSPGALHLLKSQPPKVLASVFAGAASTVGTVIAPHGGALEALKKACTLYGEKIGKLYSACSDDPKGPFVPSAGLTGTIAFMRPLLTGEQVLSSRDPATPFKTIPTGVEDAYLIAKVANEAGADRLLNLSAAQVAELMLPLAHEHSKHDASVIAGALRVAQRGQMSAEAEYLAPGATRKLRGILRAAGMPSCLELVAIRRHEFDRPEQGDSFAHMEALKGSSESGASIAPFCSPSADSFITQFEFAKLEAKSASEEHFEVEHVADLVFELKMPATELHQALAHIPGLRNTGIPVPPRVLMTATVNHTQFGMHAQRRFIEWIGPKGREALVDGNGKSLLKIGPSDELGMGARAIPPGPALSELDRLQELTLRFWDRSSPFKLSTAQMTEAKPEVRMYMRSGAIDAAVAQVVERAYKMNPVELVSILGGLNPLALEEAAKLRRNPLSPAMADKALQTCLDTGSRLGLAALSESQGMQSPKVLAEVARRGNRAQFHEVCECIIRAEGSIPESHHGGAMQALMERMDPALLCDALRHGLRMGDADVRAYAGWHSLFTTPELDAAVRAWAMQLATMKHAQAVASGTAALPAGATGAPTPSRRRSLGL